MTPIVPVLMAGGSGTRLWPLSRASCPKQFLNLLGERSLLQDTVLRAAQIPGAAAPVLLGNERHRFLIAEQLQGVGVEELNILLEPEGRNTAPAAAAAAYYLADKHGPDALMFLMAADQTIANVDAFVASAQVAIAAAQAGKLVTFGIQPTAPETGFGYVRAGEPLDAAPGAFSVSGFFEKPDRERAEQYLADGGFYWNGGMFLFQVKAFLDELKRFEPDMHQQARDAVLKAKRDIDFLRLAPEPFSQCRNISIDYAVMEKSDRVATVPLDAGWDDVGSWRFMDTEPSDDSGNHVRGDVMIEASSNNLVHAGSRLVTLLGVQDQVVVESEDAVLVASRDQVQNVGKLVERIKRERRSEADSLPRVYRPWGFYESIAAGERFQVKRISVKPGHALSLQMHHHRAEHWIVVRGTARVTCGEKTYLLSEDESTYIPLGTTHRLENPGKLPLELIEVQSGAYLGEDDIVRFEDVYGRSQGGDS